MKIQKLIGKIADYKKNLFKILNFLLLQVKKFFVLFVNQKEDKVWNIDEIKNTDLKININNNYKFYNFINFFINKLL